eukprot:Skav229017  [mRNA]  locus=scaffold127:493965:495074:- [translate_table: standard]
MGNKQRKALRKKQVGLAMKRLSTHDQRLKESTKAKATIKKKKKDEVREAPKAHSSLFFQFNSNLKPPYQLSKPELVGT